MKRIVLTLILVAFTVSAQAQMAKVQTAISHLTTYGSSFSQPELFEAPITEPDMEILMKAQEAIDIAVEHEKSKLHPKTWLTAGSVYRALSKQTAKPELHADAVNKAFECYAKVKELEEKSGKKLKLSKDAYNYTLDLKNAFYGVGYQHFDKKEYKEAFKYFKQTLDIEDMRNDNPFSKNKGTAVIDTNTIFATAYVAQQAGYNDEAIGYMQQLVDLDYNNPSVFQSLSSLYKDKGDGDMASKVMEKARKLFPDNSALVIDEINQLLKAGDEAGALEKMKEAIGLDPDNASLMFAMGSAYDKAGKTDLAVENYLKALELDADYFDAYYNLGVVYYNQAAKKTQEMNELDLNDQTNYDRLKGESESLFKEALPHFEKAMSLKGDDRNNLIALKEIYARLGMNDEYSTINDKLKAIGDQ